MLQAWSLWPSRLSLRPFSRSKGIAAPTVAWPVHLPIALPPPHDLDRNPAPFPLLFALGFDPDHGLGGVSAISIQIGQPRRTKRFADPMPKKNSPSCFGNCIFYLSSVQDCLSRLKCPGSVGVVHAVWAVEHQLRRLIAATRHLSNLQKLSALYCGIRAWRIGQATKKKKKTKQLNLWVLFLVFL